MPKPFPPIDPAKEALTEEAVENAIRMMESIPKAGPTIMVTPSAIREYDGTSPDRSRSLNAAEIDAMLAKGASYELIFTDQTKQLPAHESNYAGRNYHLYGRGQDLDLTLTYPGLAEERGVGYCAVQIDQEATRASDGIRVRYDYDRDGWVIEQPTRRSEPQVWVETAFVESWARMETETEFEARHEGFDIEDWSN